MKVAIITGAGSGVGRALSTMLSNSGWHLGLAGRRREPLDETARLCPAETEVIPTDISVPAEASSLVARVKERFGRIDALINNAGCVIAKPIGETDPSSLEKVFAINALGPGYLISAAWNHFVTQGKGCVVNLSTMGSKDPFPGLLAYAAAKTATESFVRSIVNEGAEHGIRAFAVAPGAIDTAMLRDVLDESVIEGIETLSPEEVAKVVVACIEGDRDADVGQTIYLAPG